MKYEKFIHIENINDFSKKEELYKMHEIIKKKFCTLLTIC